MKLRDLVMAMFAITLVLGCTKNEPAEETIPPAPEFQIEESMDEGMDEGMTEEENLDETM